MAPKKRKQPVAAPRARARRIIERDVFPETKSCPAGEVCGACLLPVDVDSQIGLVDNCAHVFHLDCVERWSGTENSCPQCKLRFFWLAGYSCKGIRESLTRVERRDQEGEDEDDFEDVQICESCHEIGDEGSLLLCDGMNGTCNSAYHAACVGLRTIPRGSWFCPDCVDRGFDTDSQGRQGPSRLCGDGAGGSASSQSSRARVEAPVAEVSANPLVCEPVQSILGGAETASASVKVDCNTKPAGLSESVSGTRSGRLGGVPSQMRLNALACVTPPVEVPDFQIGVSGSSGANAAGAACVFANFVQRRRAMRGGSGTAADSGGGFIKLAPTYEDDFIGKTN